MLRRGILVVLAAILGARCSPNLLAAPKRLHIVTTFLPPYCFACNVAGGAADVENLLPGTISLHDYQLSPGDIEKLSRADVVVINGLGMELFLQRAIANAGPGMKEKIVTLSDGLSTELLPLSTSAQATVPGHFDPHIWLDPTLAIHCVTNLCAALQKADPANSASYAANASNYVVRLKALDQRISTEAASVKDRAFVTYHSAFRYFARHYGLNLAGVVEKIPEVAPSARQLHDLLGVIREKNVVALFTEPYSSPRLARQIASDAGVKSAELDPLETGSLEPRAYEAGMRRNAKTLVETLR